MPSLRCPCCGQIMPPLDVGVSVIGRRVMHRGKAVTLSKMEMRLLALLWQAYPAPVAKDRLMDALYPDRLEPPKPRIVEVWAAHLRKRLDPLGIMVSTSWGDGYRLTLAEPEAIPALRQEERHQSRPAYGPGRAEVDPAVARLRKQGLSLYAIARRLELSYSAVQRSLARLDAE